MELAETPRAESDTDRDDGCRAARASRIGEILLTEGLITADDLAHALQVQASGSEWRLGRILVHQGAIDDVTITEAIARQYRVEIVDLRRTPPEYGVVRCLAPEAAHHLQALPITRDGDRVLVAVSDPPTRSLRLAVERAIDERVRLVLCPSEELSEAIRYWYRVDDPDSVVLEVETESEASSAASAAEGTTHRRDRMLSWLLLDALRRGASAVYLDLGDAGLEIRYRIGERLLAGPRLQRKVGEEALRQVLAVAQPTMLRPGVGEGKVDTEIGGQAFSVPVISVSTASRTHVVLMLGPRRRGVRRLEDLAIPEGHAQALRAVLRNDKGLVVVVADAPAARNVVTATVLDEIGLDRLVVVVRGPNGLSGVDAVEIATAAECGDAIDGLATALLYDADVVILDAGNDPRLVRSALDAADGRLLVLVVEGSDASDMVTAIVEDVGAIRAAGALAALVVAVDDSRRTRARAHILGDETFAELLDAARRSEAP